MFCHTAIRIGPVPPWVIGRIVTPSLLLALSVTVGAGCFMAPPDLPDTLAVALPGGQSRDVAAGTGPSALANTVWDCYRASSVPGAADLFIVSVEFGPQGEVARFFDNQVYFPQILGPELVPDGLIHPNAFPGMTYRAASFGASVGDEFGFAAPLNLYLAGSRVGTGVAYAYGTVSGGRIDGTFGYTTEILVSGSPFSSGGSDEYAFYALRR